MNPEDCEIEDIHLRTSWEHEIIQTVPCCLLLEINHFWGNLKMKEKKRRGNNAKWKTWTGLCFFLHNKRTSKCFQKYRETKEKINRQKNIRTIFFSKKIIIKSLKDNNFCPSVKGEASDHHTSMKSWKKISGELYFVSYNK